MDARPADVKTSIAYMILLMEFSIFLVYGTLILLGFSSSFLDLKIPYDELDLPESVAFQDFPIRVLLICVGGFTSYFLMAVSLDLLAIHLLPESPIITKYLVRRLISILIVLAILLSLASIYAVLFPDDIQHFELVRRFVILIHCLYHVAAGSSFAIMGIIFYREGLLPRWLARLILVTGILSAILSSLAVNAELPIIRYGLLYIPYNFGLVTIALYFLATRQTTRELP